MSIMKVIGGTNGNIMNPIFLRATAQFFQMAVKALDLGKELHIEGVLIEDANRILRVHSGNQHIACIPDGAQMAIFDAAMCYRAQGVPQFVFAGADYGMGSARDSAAKGTALLGVTAVFAASFERIHRTNLVCVGVLPCQFVEGRGLEFLNLAGDETFDLIRIDGNVAPQQQAVLRVCHANGAAIEVPVILRLDTPAEVQCFRQGGLLPGYLRTLVA